MSDPQAGSDVYTVQVQQATPHGWRTCQVYAMDQGMVLPAHEALRAARDFVSETYGAGAVASSYRVRVCDGQGPVVELSLQIT